MFPFESERADRPWFLLLALIALLEILILFFMAFSTAGGHFMLPLDDSYIHLQYARRMAEGAPLSYTPGMGASGGMTAPFYVLLLTPVLFLVQGAKAAFAAFVFGGVLWMLLPIWVYQLAKRLTNCLGGAIAAGLVLANGHLLWNFLSGMETGLFAILLVGAVLSAAVWWQGERPYARLVLIVCLALLPLVRPEGILAIGLLVLVVLARRGEHPRLSIPALLAAALPFATWLLILQLGTGDWKPAGLRVKGLSAFPYFNLAAAISFAGETLTAIAVRFYGNVIPDPAYAAYKGYSEMPYVAPGLGLLGALGAGLALAGEWRRRPAAATLLAFLWPVGLLTIAASLFPFVHQQRYLAPYTILAIVLAVMALHRVAQLFQHQEELFYKAAALALLLFSIPSVFFWSAEYGRNSRDIYHLHRVATFSLQGNPSPIAITDAGVLAYYTHAPVYDLVGLTSSEFTEATLQGEGITLERLSQLPQQLRPIALVSYREWFGPKFPVGEGHTLAAIPHTSITSGVRLGWYPIDWKAIELADRPPLQAGEDLRWRLDVGDLASEEVARYHFEVGPYDADPDAWPEPLAPIENFIVPPIYAADIATSEPMMVFEGGVAVDGGRAVRGESFEYWLRQNEALTTRTLYLRTAPPRLPGAPQPAAQRLRVEAKSLVTGYTAAREIILPDVPADEPLPPPLALDLTSLLDEAGGTAWQFNIHSAEPAGAAYASFGYWIARE